MSYDMNIDRERCKGCGLCASVCPKGVLELSNEVNPMGYFPAVQARPDDCNYCAICCMMCPDVAIEITETEDTAAQE
ncbi:MAG: ferredoxin family protein [Pirellulales bacterium]|nr:ferredoxin family protein [Pirellulales bacterium]